MENLTDMIANLAPGRKTNPGYCPVCERNTVFIEYGEWLRDHYRCYHCNSLPRHRAFISALNQFFPEWPDLVLHESSPSGPVYDLLKKNVNHIQLLIIIRTPRQANIKTVLEVKTWKK